MFCFTSLFGVSTTGGSENQCFSCRFHFEAVESLGHASRKLAGFFEFETPSMVSVFGLAWPIPIAILPGSSQRTVCASVAQLVEQWFCKP